MPSISQILALEIYKEYGENADEEIIENKFKEKLTEEGIRKIYQCYLALLIERDFNEL